jgi:hypothetical protein
MSIERAEHLLRDAIGNLQLSKGITPSMKAIWSLVMSLEEAVKADCAEDAK